jgi:hypothetical protein
MRFRNIILFASTAISASIVADCQTITPPAYEPSPEFQKAHPTREDNDLGLSISTKTSTIATGKDLFLDIDLENISKEPFRFPCVIETNHAEYNDFFVKVLNASGDEMHALPQEQLRRISRVAYVLQHGQIVHDHLVINHLIDISQPGTYTIYVTWKYRRSNRQIRSNTITVEVVDN